MDVEHALDRLADRFDQRFDRLDQRFDSLDDRTQTVERAVAIMADRQKWQWRSILTVGGAAGSLLVAWIKHAWTGSS